MALIGLRLVTGVMGGGKSYFMAETILKALREGAQVHTNLDLNFAMVKELGFAEQVVDLRNVDVKRMHEHIRAGDESRPNLLCLDEAALFFYVDEQNNQKVREDNKDVLLFLTWARRFGLEIYFATQSSKNVNVKLRRMSEYTIRCTNRTQIPYFGWLLSGLFGEFKRSVYLTDEDKETVLCSNSARFSAEVGKFYDTHGFVGQQANQGIVMDKVITRRVPKRVDQTQGKVVLVSFVVAVVVGVAYLYHLLTHLLGGSEREAGTVPAEVVAAQPAQSVKRAFFVGRSPRLLVWTEDGGVYYGGAQVNGKQVKYITDMGGRFVVTFQDRSTVDIATLKP